MLERGAQLGPYIVDCLLGRGGMGEVYRATDSRLHRTVAIKVLPRHVADSASRRERLAREACAVASLAHPHIRALYDIGEEDGCQFLVMEYLDGETLAERLKRGRLPLNQVLRHAIQIADGLEHAHHHGLVHRDLKPANVMLTQSGAKLLDFGLVKSAAVEPTSRAPAEASVDATESLTEEGATLGTVPYMSPEQLEGRLVDKRTDVFAFGLVLYEMATGRRAFAGGSRASMIAAILERDPPPVSATLASEGGSSPPLLDHVVAKCLAKNPDARWQTVGDLKNALTWLAEYGSETEPSTIARPRRPNRWGMSWSATSVVLLVGVLAALLMAVMGGRDRTSNDARSVRWPLSAPEGTSFDPSSQFLAVSPDGTHVAFIASSGDGRNALWVRALDSLEPRRLVDSASQPFWSPDGRFIAFNDEGPLKKIELATGLVMSLADIFVPTGSWNRDGTLLVSIHPGERRYGPRRLFTLSASGGVPVAATAFDSARGETAHSLPSFLPDGRRFLFSGSRKGPEDAILYVGSLDSPDRVELFPDHSHAVYASGYLLFARNRMLLAQPFNTSTLRLGGEPAVVAENVDIAANGVAAFSVSQTGILAYRPVGQNELVWFDRSGRALGSEGEPGHYSNPALSPDGERLAVSRYDPIAGQSDIWVLDLIKHMPSKFTFSEASEGTPLWSPDGTRLIYRSGSSLVIKASHGAGGEERLLDNLVPSEAPLGWTPDGQGLIYSSFDSGSSTSVWMLALGGNRERIPLLNTGPGYVQAAVSPDGRWMAYVSREAGGRYVVNLSPFPSGNGRWMISPSGGIEPSWRADGKELFYLAPDGSMMALTVGSGSVFEPHAPTRLFATKMSTAVNTSSIRNQYVATTDGQRFLINQPTGRPASIIIVANWPALLKRPQ